VRQAVLLPVLRQIFPGSNLPGSWRKHMPIAIRRVIFNMKEKLLILGGRCLPAWRGVGIVFNTDTLPLSSADFVGGACPAHAGSSVRKEK
jgi:hypothetical protein